MDYGQFEIVFAGTAVIVIAIYVFYRCVKGDSDD